MTLYLCKGRESNYLLTDIKLKNFLNSTDKHYYVNIISTLYISDSDIKEQLDLNNDMNQLLEVQEEK